MVSYFDLVDVVITVGLEGNAMAEFISAQLDRQRDDHAAETEKLRVTAQAMKTTKESADAKKEILRTATEAANAEKEKILAAAQLPLLQKKPHKQKKKLSNSC